MNYSLRSISLSIAVAAAAVVALSQLAVCTHAPEVLPRSRMCTVAESRADDTVRVASTGIGPDYATALVDAKKAATWCVAQQILKTPRNRQQFNSFARDFFRRYNLFLRGVVRREGTPIRDDSGLYHLKGVFDINRKTVYEFLRDRGFKVGVGTGGSVENPSVMIKGKWRIRQPALVAHIRNTIGGYLTSRKYNVIDADGAKALSGLTRSFAYLKGVGQDPTYNTALTVGADIYLVYTVWSEANGPYVKASASLKAYETTTARLIGAAVGHGRELARGPQAEFRTMEEAIRNAAERTLSRVMGYWATDARQGKRVSFMVRGRMPGEDFADSLYLAIKKIPSMTGSKRITATSKVVSFQLQYKGDVAELGIMLKRLVRRQSGIRTTRWLVRTRKLYMIHVNPGSAGGSLDLPAGM